MCAERAYAITVVYGATLNEFTAEQDLHPYKGIVRPHPELRLILDAKGEVLSSHADLAVIHLDAPVQGELPWARLARDDVRANETLVMAGYGYGEEFGQIYGLRFFRKNPVTRLSSSSAGRIIYEQQGVFLYNGFKGGPCFREDERGTWLVGIASTGTDRELACTSTRTYQEWVLVEVQRASDHSPSSSVPRGSP